jgi:CheY-like chemotaxis protein
MSPSQSFRGDQPSSISSTLDMVMPQMTGPALAERLRRQWLHLQVLLTSGSAEGSILPTFLAEPGTGFIQKPFLPNELARKLRRIARPRQVTIRHIVREAGPVSRRISRAGSRGSFQWM